MPMVGRSPRCTRSRTSIRSEDTTDEETSLLRMIEVTYQQYRKEQDQLIEDAHGRPFPEVYKIADKHQIGRHDGRRDVSAADDRGHLSTIQKGTGPAH